MPDIDIDAPGTSLLCIGNEAIARGALEAGIGFAAAYPGTPSTEILETIAKVAKRRGIYSEWSVNEMVAMEAAAGASLAGIRAIASMKANGTEVVIDFLGNLVMRGVNGGLVLVSCDDPSAISSTNEQDTRLIAKWLDIPMLEPGDFQEAKDMTKWLFELSEELGTICMLRSVTRVAHARGNIELGEFSAQKQKAYFDLNRNFMLNLQTRDTPQHSVLHKKLDKARGMFESSPFNIYEGPDKPDLLIITAGSGWLYSRDAIKLLELDRRVGILKLGTIWPLPEKFILKHLKKAQKVLIVEEIEPFIEQGVMEMVASLPQSGPHPVIYGKRSAHLNAFGEQNTDTIIKALVSLLDLTYQARDDKYRMKAEDACNSLVPTRTMTFCPGCPHRATFWAIKNALALDGRHGLVIGDVGCYGLSSGFPGYSTVKASYCMGASVGVAHGLGSLGQFGFVQPVIAVCGDSTFYHAAIPGLINSVVNQSNIVFLILDNNATAMTGFQPNAGTGTTASGEQAKVVKIDDVCRSLGANIKVCDPFDLVGTTATLLEVMRDEGNGPRILIMRRQCELIRAKNSRSLYKVRVNPDACIGEVCGCNRLCTRLFRCPGLTWDKHSGKSVIDELICSGCGLCVQICPQKAITKEAA